MSDRTRAPIGPRAECGFAEDPLDARPRLAPLDAPRMPDDLPSLAKLDPGLADTRRAMDGCIARNGVAPLPMAPPAATRWMRFSPFELFLEHVVARRLGDLE